MAQYKRILLKLSGESLMGGKQYGIDEVRLICAAYSFKRTSSIPYWVVNNMGSMRSA